MTYYNDTLDIEGITDEDLRSEFSSVYSCVFSSIIAKIIEANLMLRLKDPTITSEDLELGILYTVSYNVRAQFEEHMKVVDEKEERYSMSDSRFKGAQKLLSQTIKQHAVDRDFIILFDHWVRFLTKYLQNIKKNTKKTLLVLYRELVLAL